MESLNSSVKTLSLLNPSQKRGIAGLCTCSLSIVNDSSIDRKWSKSFLALVMTEFLNMSRSELDAFAPLVANSKQYADLQVDSNRVCTQRTVEQEKCIAFLGLLESNNQISLQDIYKCLLRFIVKSAGYDARARTMFRHLSKCMKLVPVMIEEEIAIGRILYAEATGMLESKYGVKKKSGIWDWKRNMAIGAAAITGGALLAVTGGLAAPAISASLAAFGTTGAAIGTVIGSTAGVTATSVLFGTTGAGVIGMKTDKRTRGVHELCFDLITAGDGLNVYICVNGWLDESDKEISEDQDLCRIAWGDSHAFFRMYYQYHNPDKLQSLSGMLARYRGREEDLYVMLQTNYCKSSDKVGDTKECTKCQAALEDAEKLFHEAVSPSIEQSALLHGWWWKKRFEQGDQYCLLWEDKLLVEFGKAMRSVTKDQLVRMFDRELIKHTTLAALFASVQIPRAIFRVFDMIDNIWTLMTNAADESGKILAQALCKREQGLRPVTLIGYGMGARLIFSCLLELYKQSQIVSSAQTEGNAAEKSIISVDCLGIVENVVLLGTPMPASGPEWVNIRSVIAGRLVNGYSKNDWMLALMYRYQKWSVTCAGISPLEIVNVENIDLSSIIKGHMEYKHKIAAILDLVNLETK